MDISTMRLQSQIGKHQKHFNYISLFDAFPVVYINILPPKPHARTNTQYFYKQYFRFLFYIVGFQYFM